MSGLNSLALALSLALSPSLARADAPATGGVEVRQNRLVVDGLPQPQLFGAELQYFRLRGGYGPNLPREQVLALWNRALDRLVEARMNAVSFYIPWDFHEYAEGKFDFTGTADADGDGRADYPSRDLITFFRLLAEHGITRIMVRPGPYINAEWGFLGFGAIPSWFHDKYPDSHMRTPFGLRSKLYDYHDPDLVRHTGLWFRALRDQVLADRIGPGKPVIFLQIDNETNYQWQSVFAHDYGRHAVARYQDFLREGFFGEIAALNRDHGRDWDRWTQVRPPANPGRELAEDRSWYRFADHTIFTYLRRIRELWEGLEIREPRVLFTLAESYNAPVDGLLPHFVLRNSPGATGLMTVNLYPKTAEEPGRPLLNFPFKADLDVKAADEANDAYLGSRQEWVLGPEIQGGWWRGIEVSAASRQQTYLTVLGHGLKAFFVYYFNEGQNWDAEWAHRRIQPLYAQLLWERRLADDPTFDRLPEDFWNELQARTDRQLLVGFDVRRIIKGGPAHDTELFFDAPLDGEARPRAHFHDLKRIGELVVAPHQEFLARSLEAHDDVALVKDSASHAPGPDRGIPAAQAAADWTGGLLGMLMTADVNPRVLHGDLSPQAAFDEPRLLAHLDTGLNAERTLAMLRRALARGATVLNFLADDATRALVGVAAAPATPLSAAPAARAPLTFHVDGSGRLRPAGERGTTPVRIAAPTSGPLHRYALDGTGCEAILYSGPDVVGYRCRRGAATVVQVGALIFEQYNSSAYARLSDPAERRRFLRALLAEAGVESHLRLSDDAVRAVAFARRDPARELLWITVKTGEPTAQSTSLRVDAEFLRTALDTAPAYSVTDLLSGRAQTRTGTELSTRGFDVALAPHGSAVYVLRALARR